MPKMTWKQLKELIEKDGWILDHVTGSHRQYKHPNKPNVLTLSYHKVGDMVPTGTLLDILRTGGLR